MRLSTPRARLAVVGVAAAGVLAVLGIWGSGDDLVYYRTPSEIAAKVRPGERVRLGGLVEQGTLRRDGSVVRFIITDGARDLPVTYDGATTAIFREGQGVLVEGSVDGRGRFVADTLLVKHSNQYVTKTREKISDRAGRGTR